jgi:hypothetical protein
MPQPPDFQDFCTDFRRLRGFIDEVRQTGALNPIERQRLEELTAEMDKQFADLQETYPQAVAALDKQMEETRAVIDKTQGDIAQTQSRLDEMMKAQAAPPTAPEMPAVALEPIDPELGRTLRRELLERLGLQLPEDQRRQDYYGDVWESRDQVS